MHDDPLALLSALVAIPSVNSDLVSGADGEAAIADACEAWLDESGFVVERLESRPGHPSIVATSPGSGAGRSLMLNGHLDTVGISTFAGEAFTTRISEGKIFGRGTFDMKSGLAAILVAATRAARVPHRGDIVVALVADEEFGSSGTEDVLRHYRSDAAIVVEPSGLELTVAHRGFAWFEVQLVGRSAHGSQPDLGLDAIAGAGAILQQLETLSTQLRSRASHHLLGHGTVRVSKISGGVDAATVAPTCQLSIERRTLPGDNPDQIKDELRELIAACCTPRGLGFTLTRLVARAAFETQEGSPIVDAVVTAAVHVIGHSPAERGEPFWTDAGLISEAGIDCLVFGVDGGGAHADEEWATVDSVVQLTDVLERTIIDFCA